MSEDHKGMDSNYARLITGKEEEGQLWELYHENSRITPYQAPIAYEELRSKTLDLLDYEYQGYPSIPLVDPLEEFEAPLAFTMKRRRTALSLSPCDMSQQQLSTLLHYSYGVSQSNENNGFPDPFRMVPSAGALYPLEIYFHHNYVSGLDAGLYHYGPLVKRITRLQKGDSSRKLREVFVQPEVPFNSSVLFFITAVFERSSFKYGERAYRFVHLEAGHLAQNMSLAAHAMGFGAVTIGGFLDRKANEFLGCDGLHHAVIYIMAIGKNETEQADHKN